MKRLLVLFVVAIGYGALAGESPSPERLGAHWARVSDHAAIEMIVDELKAVAQGRASAVIAQRHLAGNLAASNVAKASRVSDSDAEEIEIADGKATVRFGGGVELELKKVGSTWFAVRGSIPQPLTSSASTELQRESGASVGRTFIETPVSREHSIDRLSRGVTIARIDRRLFGAPERTASYYSAHYTDRAPFVTATYIQLALDPSWNRIVYGNLDRWIKVYDNVRKPTSIAVDADGRVFVGEAGNQWVSVFRIVGEGENAQLLPLFKVENIGNPSDVALSDNGTPLNTQDDILYVADGSANVVYKYAVSSVGASRIATFDGFDTPTSILVGRWNGANNNLLYAIDKVAKRVRLFEDNGSSLIFVRELAGTHKQYFSSLKTDHFGNVYIVDNVNSELFKYTASLEFLDSEGGDRVFESLAHIDIPFGRVTIDGQGTFWAGFDQMFAVERWADGSGAQRRTLGLAMRNIGFRTDGDVSVIENDFTLTDFADVTVKITNSENELIRTLHSSWMVSGGKTLAWDRRGNEGAYVAPGSYRYQIESRPAYRDEKIVSLTRFSLPMYYWEDAGSMNALEDAHLVQGSAVRWSNSPSQTANEHASSVQYRFTGMNPESEYEIAAEYVAHDGVRRIQDMTVNGQIVHEPLSINDSPQLTGWIRLAKPTFESGEIVVSVNKRAEGSAIISQLWIKETGTAFAATQINETIPSAYFLSQNYPNPFNPSTIIRYAIPDDGNVNLRVFDITGREVATLVNEFKRAGSYEVRFAASLSGGRNLASGIYFYHLKAGGFTQTKKMVLVK